MTNENRISPHFIGDDGLPTMDSAYDALPLNESSDDAFARIEDSNNETEFLDSARIHNRGMAAAFSGLFDV